MYGLNQTNALAPPRLSEQLPPDSSGIGNMSSPSGSSDSGSSGMMMTPEGRSSYATPSPGMGTTAKTSPGLSKVQNQSSPLPAKSPVMSPSQPKKSPSSGATGADESRQKTDLFLSQFQAQMSQMKSAMDELLMHKSNSKSSPSSSGGGGGGGGTKRVGGSKSSKKNAAPTGTIPAAGPATTSVTYQSQISTANGLKLKIKKSPKTYKKRGPKGKRGRRKRKDDDDDMDDLSDFEDEAPRAKVARSSAAAASAADNDREPSGWGDKLPKQALELILTHGVSEDGCIPFLVRTSRVSRLWRKVSSNPEMWTHVDLSSPRVKHVYRTERNLLYFLEHRFFHAKHLNLGKISLSKNITHKKISVLSLCFFHNFVCA